MWNSVILSNYCPQECSKRYKMKCHRLNHIFAVIKDVERTSKMYPKLNSSISHILSDFATK